MQLLRRSGVSSLTRDWRIDVASCLYGFDSAHGLVLLDGRANLGQVNIHNVSQLVLRVVGDADGADAALDCDPLVVLSQVKTPCESIGALA